MRDMTEIKTRIEDNQDKRDELLHKSANLVSEFVLDGSAIRNEKQIATDVSKLLKGYSNDEIITILLKSLAIVGRNATGSRPSKNKSNGYNQGISDSAAFLKNRGR